MVIQKQFTNFLVLSPFFAYSLSLSRENWTIMLSLFCALVELWRSVYFQLAFFNVQPFISLRNSSVWLEHYYYFQYKIAGAQSGRVDSLSYSMNLLFKTTLCGFDVQQQNKSYKNWHKAIFSRIRHNTTAHFTLNRNRVAVNRSQFFRSRSPALVYLFSVTFAKCSF